MTKTKLNPSSATYPMPVALVGAQVNDKPNYAAVAWFTQSNMSPVMMTVALNRSRYTAEGIIEKKAFSVNIPSAKMVESADYCGMVSGKKIDKSLIFKTFYGDLKTAPMIMECPLSIECRLFQTSELPTHNLFSGEVAAVYANSECVSDGKIDMMKLDPFILSISGSQYLGLGKEVGRAWSSGRKLMK